MNVLLRRLSARSDVLVLIAILLAIQLFPNHMPGGIYGLGVVHGAQLALLALGIILVYRSTGIINFAQVQIGSVAAVLFACLVQYSPLVRLLEATCEPCSRMSAIGSVNYWVSLALSLGFAVLLSWAIYMLVIKRFREASPLVVSIATVFIAQLLAGIQGQLPTLLGETVRGEAQGGTAQLQAPRLPFDWSFAWASGVFHLPEIALVIAALAAVAGIVAYLRFSVSGLAIRAASESPSRAETIGIDVPRVTGRVWIIAGLLSGVAAVIPAINAPPSSASPLDMALLLQVLGVAVIARMQDLRVAGLAAAAFGILSVALVWSFQTDVILSGVLLLVLVCALLLQTGRGYRLDSMQGHTWRLRAEARAIPAALRRLPVVRIATRLGVALLIIGLVGMPWTMAAEQISLSTFVLIYAIVAYSLLVLTGWAGQVSLGQFGLAAVGAYVAALSSVPFPLAITLGALAGAAAAGVVGLPALRLRALHLAVTTLALAVAVPALLLQRSYLGSHLPQTLGRPSFVGVDLADDRLFYYVTLGVLTAVVVGVLGMRRSRVARILRAGRDNPTAAQTFGINLMWLRLAAFAVSGFIAGLGGALLAFHEYGVRIAAYGADQSVTVLSLAVIGGLGSMWGPLLGAAYFAVLTFTSTGAIASLFATGAGGLLLLLFIQGGLSQVLFRIRDAALRRLARQHEIEAPTLGVTVAARRRAPIFPKLGPGGHRTFVPVRYRLTGQWAVTSHDGLVTSEGSE